MHAISGLRIRLGGLCALSLLAVGCGGGGGGGSGGGGGGGGGGSVSQDLASVTPTPQVAARISGPGDFAADYLRSTHFRSLVVEIDYPAGKAPSPEAVNLLQERLAERCDKPDGVTVQVDDAIPASEFPPVLSVSDLAALEQAHRSTFSNAASETAAFYILYVSGHSDADSADGAVLGLAYAGSSIGFFIDQADPGPVPLVTKQEVEGAGVVHESGHLLGLVDGGTPMVTPHEDAQHVAHCDDSTCVMYWVITIDPLANITDTTFAEFDAHCSADMTAFGGRALPLIIQAQSARSPGSAAERVAVGRCGNSARVVSTSR